MNKNWRVILHVHSEVSEHFRVEIGYELPYSPHKGLIIRYNSIVYIVESVGMDFDLKTYDIHVVKLVKI